MKPESQQKILYSKALQGSTMSQQNNSSQSASSPTSSGGSNMSSNNNNSSYHSNEPNSSYHKGPNSSGHYGGNHGRNINHLPPRMAKNLHQSNYANRHNQPYYRISSTSTNTQQSSASPSTTSVSTSSASVVNVQQQQQSANNTNTNNKVSTNGSTSIVASINPLSNSNNSSNNSSGTINNSSSNNLNNSLSMSSTSSTNNNNNNNSTATNGGVSGGGTSISDKSDSSMAINNNSNSNNNSTISKTNLYIRGLTPDTTDKDLHSLCQLYGTIVSTKAILDKETQKCRGYGFVDFDNPSAAEAAVKNLNEQGVQAQMAKCTDTSRNKNLQQNNKNLPQEHDPTNLYIANLPINMTEEDLQSMLSMHGTVVSTRILKDPNSSASRGVGFARMETKDECDIIIEKYNGKLIPGCRDMLLVKFADGGSKKKNHYKNESRYRSDIDQLQMTFDSTNLTPNGVTAAMLPSPLGAAYNQRFSSPYQNPLQPNPWMHAAAAAAAAAAAPQPQYIMQPPMMAPNMDPNSLQYATPLMHQLTAQLHNLQLGGVSGTGFMAGNPHAYGQQLYQPQLIPTMQMSGVGGDQDPINPSHSVSSGSVSGEEQQNQQVISGTQQPPPSHSFQMCYNQQK